MPRRLEPSGSLRAYFGWRLRHWRRSRNMTQDALGQRIGYDNSQISKVESGDRWPPEDLAHRSDEVLSTGGELGGLWPLVNVERQRDAGEMPAAAREEPATLGGPAYGTGFGPGDTRLGLGGPSEGGPAPGGRLAPGETAGAAFGADGSAAVRVRGAARLDDAAIGGMTELLAAYRRAGDHVHAATLVPPVEWHLDGLLRALTEQSAPPARLLPLAAEWAELAGWLRFDLGAHHQALAWYDRGHQWATAARDPDLASRLLARKATAAWEDRDPVAAVGYAQAARETPGIGPGARTWAALAEARAQALAGDRYACEKLLATTAEEVAQAGHEPGPAWWWLRGPAGERVPQLARATCLRELAARGVPSLGRQAAAEFAAALAAIGGASPRDEALFSARLAGAYVHAADPERAADAAVRATEASVITRSHRAARELAAVHAGLRTAWPDLPRLPDLTDRLRAG
jgi:DNA-binding XRE family transcriptional regulator